MRRPVKYAPPSGRKDVGETSGELDRSGQVPLRAAGSRRALLTLGALGTVAALGSLAPSAGSVAARSVPSARLLVSAALPEVRGLAPHIPEGALLGESRTRPVLRLEARRCDLEGSVCVHGGTEAEAERALAALLEARRLVEAVLELPTPRGDSGRGGYDGLDVYLEPGPTLVVEADPPRPRGFDSASGYCRAAPPLGREAAVRCVGELSALSLDAGLTRPLRVAFGQLLATELLGPSNQLLAQLDEAQAAPERALLEGPEPGAAVGWLAYLEQRFGRRTGELSMGLVSLAASETPAESARFREEPDFFDALRGTFGGHSSGVAELFADFSAGRAFWGNRDDGAHFPSWGWAGSFGRPRLDWQLHWSELPKRVAFDHGVGPGGCVFTSVEMDLPAQNKALALEMEWETPAVFDWTLIRLDRDGREAGRVRLPLVSGGTRVQHVVEKPGEAASWLLVGTPLGGIDASHPFDPDTGAEEAHQGLIYITQL